MRRSTRLSSGWDVTNCPPGWAGIDEERNTPGDGPIETPDDMVPVSKQAWSDVQHGDPTLVDAVCNLRTNRWSLDQTESVCGTKGGKRSPANNELEYGPSVIGNQRDQVTRTVTEYTLRAFALSARSLEKDETEKNRHPQPHFCNRYSCNTILTH